MKETLEVDGEKVHLKKDFLGWHVTHPIKNEDGTTNWKNLIAGGSWVKLIIIAVFVLILVGAIFEISSVYKIANECLANNTFQDVIINKALPYP